MNIIRKISLSLAAFTALFALTPNLALADAKSQIQCGVNVAASGDCTTQPSGDLNTTIKTIVNILTAIVGIAAVIMIIVAGLRYVTSGGNADSAKSARNTILYAVIGLVVVALAQLIVHFAIHAVNDNQVNKAPSNSSGSGASGSGSSGNNTGPLRGSSIPQ